MVKSLRLTAGAERGTARIRLEPPELGEVRIQARLEGQNLRVLVETETRQAGELLRGRLKELRDALEQHGLRTDRLEVVVAGADRVSQLDDPQPSLWDRDGGGVHRGPDSSGGEGNGGDGRAADREAAGRASADAPAAIDVVAQASAEGVLDVTI